MIQTTHYDAIVIGAGQSGGPLSIALANAGWKTAIIERVHVGGAGHCHPLAAAPGAAAGGGALYAPCPYGFCW